MHVSAIPIAYPMPPLAADVWPTRPSSRLLRAAVLMVLGSVFIAACAQVSVPLWPVPVTGQTFAVLTVGLAYGWRLGGATLALYLAEGFVGLPVFANFSAGPAVFAGPTGGYLIGFVLAAAFAGYLAERGWDRRTLTTAAAMALSSFIILACGVAWLSLYYAGPGSSYISTSGAQGAFGAALATGFLPFVLGDVIKCGLAALIMPLARKLAGRQG